MLIIMGAHHETDREARHSDQDIHHDGRPDDHHHDQTIIMAFITRLRLLRQGARDSSLRSSTCLTIFIMLLMGTHHDAYQLITGMRT